MKTQLWMIGVLMIIVSLPQFALAANQTPIVPTDDYVIGRGDVLDISVWKDEALTKLVTVLPDGKISFPLIGQVKAGGMTVAQLRNVLEKKLKRFVPDLTLSIVVSQVNSMVIYVIGRVNNPGRFGLNTNINVLQALAIAGGVNPFAKRSKIRVFREDQNGTQIFPFDYDDVAKGEDLQQNIRLKRGDIVFVP